MQGIITLKAVNVETGAVEHEQEQENILGDRFILPAMLNGEDMKFIIRLSTAVWKPTPYPECHHNSSLGFETLSRFSDVFGVAGWSFIDETVTTPAMLQYSGRFAPPATGQTRTIKSVILQKDSTTTDVIKAFTELSVPCVQTDSQYYDIYYRIIFDYAETVNGLKWDVYKSLIKGLISSSVTTIYNDDLSRYVSAFPSLKVNVGDTSIPIVKTYEQSSYQYGKFTYVNVSSSSSSLRNYHLNLVRGVSNYNFDERSGSIIANLHTGYNYFRRSQVSSTDLFQSVNKIQNVFGYSYESTNINSNSFLDIDALANGSGKLSIGGVWQNKETTANENLYFKTEFPKRSTITITGSGAIGTATYKYATQPFIRVANGVDMSNANVPKNSQIMENIVGLGSVSGTNISNISVSDRGVLGDVRPTVFTYEQLSAITAYDGSSVLIPKKDQIVLYSIPASRYWRITGAFTNIHQLAVKDGVVYIACRNTGLWSVNPRVSLAAQPVTVTGYRTANFTGCNGVSIGYNNKLWAVGNDALACLDAGVWTIYDSTTANPFTPSSYANINYLKVDIESATDQMLFVYKETPNVKLGFWWSVVTPVVETSNLVDVNSRYHCKRNKGHIYGLQGHWLYHNNQYLTFGSTAAPLTKTDINSDCSKHTVSVIIRNGSNYNVHRINDSFSQRLSNLDGTLSKDLFGKVHTNHNVFSFSGIIDVYSQGRYEYFTSFALDNGLVFQAGLYNCWDGNYGYISTDFQFTAAVGVLGLDNTPHGGTTRNICRKEYGWNGTAWELNHAGSKTTHADAQPLEEGVTIAFTNGATGTSFVSNNVYKFGLCDGILKDNATRLSLDAPVFYTKTVSGSATLTSNTVPASTALSTGIVTAHATLKSKDAFTDASNRVTFPGNNLGQFAVGDKQVTGNFEISVSCADIANALTDFTFVGVGKCKRGAAPLLELRKVSTSAVQAYVRNSSVYLLSLETTSTGLTSLTSASTVGIKRVGNVITVTKNGVSVYTVADAGAIAELSFNRLDIMFGVGYSTQNYVAANKFCPVTTIISNGTDNAVKLGNELAGTEAFDINCKQIVPSSPITVKLNGSPAIVKTVAATPIANEVIVDPNTMTLTFHPSDEGKSLEVDCTRVWNR